MKSITTLKGVGTERAKQLGKKGITTVDDLLYYFPRTNEDRTHFSEIANTISGEFVCLKTTVYSPVKETRIKKNLTIYSMTVYDDSGSLSVVWYNNRFVKGVFRTGDTVLLYGKVVLIGKKREIQNPVYEFPEKQRYIGRIVPIYPLFGNITQKIMATLMEEAIKDCGCLEESLPNSIRVKYGIADISYCVKNIHFPDSYQDYEAARKRFIFEELFYLRLALISRREKLEKKERTPFRNTDCVIDFIKSLPFKLTNAQKRAIDEICIDVRKDTPMNRLVQGDVGSGKTVVAAAGMYLAYKNGYQSVIMAPTEILATQHYDTFFKLLQNTDIKIALLTKSTKNKIKLCELIKNGEYDIIIGTNAVIQDKVEYKRLGFVVADEQHRFGVTQRAILRQKGDNPNTLIMTATPIPRTLSLILYGDLDISVIDELPPGRKPVLTYAVGESMRERVYAFLENNIKNGMQAYIVCPLVEESEKEDFANVIKLQNKLTKIFPNFSIGLIHGRLKPDEKEEVMQSFLNKKIDVLVATTVIEVGVNVPNSNIMIIENAERFGLSTLHQLRGRVGRGRDQAYCIMFAQSNSEITKQRMKTMCSSNDGFYISEQDLKLRGPGDFFGTRQHGLPEMKIANLFTDSDLLKAANEGAEGILSGKTLISEEEKYIIDAHIKKVIPESIVLN